jgi:exonuclease III
MEWEAINERIMTARFHGRFRNVTIIQCYAPTNNAEEGTKEQFYNKLQHTIDKQPKGDIKVLMGDLNAKVGNDNTGRETIMRKEGLGKMNENGELFTEFCGLNGLSIGGTLFAHRRYTRQHGDPPT